MNESVHKIVIVGGGAAGIFAAANLPIDRKIQVVVVEKGNKLLQKVKASGGGRCNVTHACFEVESLLKYYPRGGPFIKKEFYQFQPANTISWFEERGVKLKKEADGRMFPVTDNSQTIIDVLLREAHKRNIEWMFNREVVRVTVKDSQFEIGFKSGQSLFCDQLLIASGGFPKKEAFQWIKELGHSISDPVPSLFTFNLPKHPIVEMMGVAVSDVRVQLVSEKMEQRGPLLITHWGVSGPCILKLSAWAARELAMKNWNFKARIIWLPEYNENSLREEFQRFRTKISGQLLINRNPFGLPSRLWEFLLQQTGIQRDVKWGQLNLKHQKDLIIKLVSYEVEVQGKTGFKEEFVTAGGVSLREVDPLTMMSKKHSGLYFAGEILDVDGITGGFNFQHAWSSAWIASKSMAEKGLGL